MLELKVICQPDRENKWSSIYLKKEIKNKIANEI